MAEQGKLLVVDACVAINVVATRRWKEIFGATQWLPLMPRIALQEVLYLFDADGERMEISLSDLEEAGELAVDELSGDQLSLMLRLVAEVGRGEAAAIAIARSRELPLATDDRAAQLVAQIGPDRLMTTPGLVREWAEAKTPRQSEIVEVIELIETRASYRPSSRDPAFAWWNSQRPTDRE